MADYDKPRGHDLPPGVVHADANVESQNWIRQSWPLEGPASYQADMIAGDRGWPKADAQLRVNTFMQGWIAQWLPEDVKAELERRGLVVPPPRYGPSSR